MRREYKKIKALKFTSLQDGSVVGFANQLSESYNFYYSYDGNEWIECPYSVKWSVTLNGGG